MKHKILGDFITNIIEVRILKFLGEISIATNYLPSRRAYFSYPYYHKPTYNNHNIHHSRFLTPITVL